MHDVGVVQILPVHRGEEEELGDGVEADEDVQEGAKQEIPKNKFSLKKKIFGKFLVVVWSGGFLLP